MKGVRLLMKKNLEFPISIIVEGLDGTGKTTNITMLVDYLENQGFSVKRFRSPYLSESLDLIKLTGDGRPLCDNFADTLVFAFDNIFLSSEFSKWKRSGKYDYLVSQRGIGGFYEHSAVRGFSYAESNTIQKIANSLASPSELKKWRENETYISNILHLIENARDIFFSKKSFGISKVAPFCHADVRVHFNAEPKVAYSRICDDPLGDKFETPKYMSRQAEETLLLHQALTYSDPELKDFLNEIQLYLDTTDISIEESFQILLRQLRKIGAIQ